jgi:hypothetical protein
MMLPHVSSRQMDTLLDVWFEPERVSRSSPNAAHTISMLRPCSCMLNHHPVCCTQHGRACFWICLNGVSAGCVAGAGKRTRTMACWIAGWFNLLGECTQHHKGLYSVQSGRYMSSLTTHLSSQVLDI